MGCTTSTPQARKMLRVPTLFGALHITVLNCHLDRNTNLFMAMDPYIKILISNQPKSTQVKEKGGFDPRFDQDFVYIINSCYKPYGRSMELFVLDKRAIGSDQLIGYGLLDLDFLIKSDNNTNDVKVRLNYKCKEIGWANLKVRFEELPKQSVNFRIETIQNLKDSFQGCKHCFVKMTIGEQIFQTPKMKDTPENPPIWNDQGYQFEIPKCINTALFEVFDEKKLIGKIETDIGPFLKVEKQTNFKQEVKNEDGEITGVLKFSVMKGDNVEFQADKTIYKKIVNVVDPKLAQKLERKKKLEERREEEEKKDELQRQEAEKKKQEEKKKEDEAQVEKKEQKAEQAPKAEEAPQQYPEIKE